MLRTIQFGVILFAATLLTKAALAQTEPPKAPVTDVKSYRVEFVVQELEGGKVINSRSYSMVVSSDRSRNSVRTGAKVPYSSGASGSSVQYLNVGVRIDCTLEAERSNQLQLNVTADINSVQPQSPPSEPVIRQNTWSSVALVPLRKPMLLFTADDLTSKREMQLEVTAAPL